jgi:hypothetical protein
MFLFPVVLGVRLLSRVRKGHEREQVRSDIKVPSAPVNGALAGLLSVERALLRKVRLPFGSSVAVVAVKPRRAS